MVPETLMRQQRKVAELAISVVAVRALHLVSSWLVVAVAVAAPVSLEMAELQTAEMQHHLRRMV